MPDSKRPNEVTPSLSSLERPLCPRCQTRMELVRIMPGPAGFELRNFECDKCERVVTVTAASDPMRSAAIGWIFGELGSPS